ncbi:MAG: L-2-amino-thiazoline-4-carboxylic acid hydrolase [Anaerolineae bacterium]
MLGPKTERGGIMNDNNFDQSERRPREESDKHEFQEVFHQTYEDAFVWRFRYYIDIMQRFAEYLGRDRLIEMIKCAVDERDERSETDDTEHTFTRYIESGKNAFENMMTWEVIEESDRVYEIEVTECLWANTFQDRNATDIGYATICYSDLSEARAYHSKLKLERTKTIMQGHGCCNHRWTWGE